MAKMKWIYQMVQDGTFEVFKLVYNHAKKNNEESFKFDNKEFDLLLAQAIIQIGEQSTNEYDTHVDQQALKDFKQWSVQHRLS